MEIGHTFYSWSTFIVMEAGFLLYILSSACISLYIFSTLFTIFRPIKSTLYSVFYWNVRICRGSNFSCMRFMSTFVNMLYTTDITVNEVKPIETYDLYLLSQPSKIWSCKSRKFHILWASIKQKILLRRIYGNKQLQFCYQLCRRQKQGHPGTKDGWQVKGRTKMSST